MLRLIKILFIALTMMSLVSCGDAFLCEIGSATACSRYNREVWRH